MSPTIKPLQRFVERACSKRNPDYVLVWRDGVGDSMIEQVEKEEIPQVREATKNAKLSYVIVQKRIMTRFFIRANNGTIGNPARGTLVESQAGSTKYKDFFLVPTICTLSTVHPVHYVIAVNDSIPMGELQQLTYNMCFMYPNWPDSIKLPAPTQCAHKLAYLVGETHLTTDPQVDKSLLDTLWYL